MRYLATVFGFHDIFPFSLPSDKIFIYIPDGTASPLCTR
jgi:hypothetical protein